MTEEKKAVLQSIKKCSWSKRLRMITSFLFVYSRMHCATKYKRKFLLCSIVASIIAFISHIFAESFVFATLLFLSSMYVLWQKGPLFVFEPHFFRYQIFTFLGWNKIKKRWLSKDKNKVQRKTKKGKVSVIFVNQSFCFLSFYSFFSGEKVSLGSR